MAYKSNQIVIKEKVGQLLMNIPFNRPPVVGSELVYINEVIESKKLSGDGLYTKKSEKLLEEITDCKKVLLTPSCTAALELAALLLDLKEGDEVIMPSYTFVSTANAFALRGAKIVFVDIQKDTMNIDPVCIKNAITSKTRVIVPVHYAGVACEMDAIMALASQHDLFVVEDAAQAIGCYYKGKPLGSIGHFGTFSFHETKNITSGGEGGALLINDEQFIERAEVIREKGTNRSQFFRGAVDKYSWVDIGSSYLLSEIQAAYLYGQLLNVNEINDNRRASWNFYFQHLAALVDEHKVLLPFIPDYATANAHMFYLKCKDIEERTLLIKYLKQLSISAPFHYVPLHSAAAGEKYGVFHGDDIFTTIESENIVRLPLYYGMLDNELDMVAKAVNNFYLEHR